MRMLCPVTCGCADRLSGQALLAPEWGCPSPCAEAAAANLRTAPCEDTAPSEPCLVRDFSCCTPVFYAILVAAHLYFSRCASERERSER